VWTPQNSGATDNLRGVGAGSASRVWAVGDRGTVMTFDGTSWSRIEINGQPPFYDVHAIDATRAWAVGAGGRVIQLNNATYSNYVSGSSQNLYAVVGTSATAVYVGGGNGEFLRFNGTSWTSPVTNTTADITDLAFPTPSTGYYVTAGGQPGKTTNSGTTWTALLRSMELVFPAPAVPAGAPVTSVRATLVFRASAVPATDTVITVRASFDGGTTWTSRTLTRPTSTATVTQTVDFVPTAPSAAALQANGVRLEFRVTSGNSFTTSHDMVRIDVN
jgi:hypothetical protein